MDERLCLQTRFAFLFSRIFTLPFWGMFILIPMILCKELNATTMQITTAIALKPIASLLSPYWSMRIFERQDRIVNNIFWANILKYLPFLFFPWVTNNWFIVSSIGLYWALKRGVIPAWMEAIKLSIPKETRSKLFATGSTIDYLGGVLFPLLFGFVLDSFTGSWRWIFFGTAVISIFSSYFIYRIPKIAALQNYPPVSSSIYKKILLPWKRSYNLLKKRPDFTKFQIGFMLGGAGLMFMQPALQKYFVEVLDLSYTKMLLAIAAFKGIGFALTSRIWARAFNRSNIFRFCSYVTLFASLFPFILLLSAANLSFLYIAFLIYGAMQAGSEMSWHMSGPTFSDKQDSSIFSSTNVLAIGTRGLIFPYLGGYIYSLTNSITVMILGALICACATLTFKKWSKPHLSPT